MVGTTTTTTDAGSLLVNTIMLMLDDPTFSIQSAPAVPNRKLAQHLVKWMPDHKDIATKFEKELIKLLSTCIAQKTIQRTKAKTTRDKMWTAYHKN